jgi:hypothetical protein
LKPQAVGCQACRFVDSKSISDETLVDMLVYNNTMTKNNNHDSSSKTKYSKLPAARGVAWLVAAWTLIRSQTIRLLLISLFFQFFLSFAQAGMLGLVVVLCLPVLSAGILQSLQTADSGKKPMLALLFAGFSNGKSLSKLLLLGAIVMVVGFLIVTLVMSGQVMNLDPEVLKRIETGDLDAIQSIDPQILQNALYAMLIGAAISGTLTYFAVPLIWFKDESVGQSLMAGLAAMAGNWKPLLVTGLLLGLLAAPIGLLFGIFFLSSLQGSAISSVLAFLILLFVPLFQLLVFGTQYTAFREIFNFEVNQPEDGSSSDGQLVA